MGENNFSMKGHHFAKYQKQLFFTKCLIMECAWNGNELFTISS
jgi:hypothetical protein